MKGSLGRKIRLLATIRSVPAGSVLGRAATFPIDYRRRSGRSLHPLNVTLDLTFRCNLSCPFCFNRTDGAASRGVTTGGGLGPTLEEIASVVSQAAGWATSFYLTGGEPLLREDLPAIVSMVRSAGLACGVSTNGTLLATNLARALLRAGLTYLIVSPHSLDAGCGDGREIETIERLGRGRGETRLLLNYVLDGRNSAGLGEVVRLAEAARADALCIQHLTFLVPAERTAHRESFLAALTNGSGQPGTGGEAAVLAPISAAPPLVTPSDIERLLEDCAAARRTSRVPLYSKPDLDEEHVRLWYLGPWRPRGRCSYPWTDIRIRPDGTVPFCQFVPFEVGNIRDEGLRAIWNGARYRALRRALRRAGGTFPACARCCKLYRSV